MSRNLVNSSELTPSISPICRALENEFEKSPTTMKLIQKLNVMRSFDNKTKVISPKKYEKLDGRKFDFDRYKIKNNIAKSII